MNESLQLSIKLFDCCLQDFSAKLSPQGPNS